MPAIPIAESAQHYVAANVAPSVDRDGAQQVDPAGQPLWEVRVMAMPEPEPGRDRLPMPEIIRVQVPAAAPPDLQFGQPVRFRDLVARTWASRDGRQGLMYQASATITPSSSALPSPAKPAGQ